jgi:hypothetical protein
MAGDRIEILPDTIHLALGVKDVLLLRNQDDVPQIFGPTLIMPGQSFRLPFETASEYLFACTAHASGQMKVIVDPAPTPGWARFQWRLWTLARAIRSEAPGPPGGQGSSVQHVARDSRGGPGGLM